MWAAMDIGLAIAWRDRLGQKALPQEPQSLEDLVRLIHAERAAREAALAEAQKHMEWRFEHFAEDFGRRLVKVERNVDRARADMRNSCMSTLELTHLALGNLDHTMLSPESGRGADDLHRRLLEGKLALAESCVAEAQRHSNGLKSQASEQASGVARRMEEAEARLARLEGCLAELQERPPRCEEGRGCASVASRLAAVERLTLEAQPPELQKQMFMPALLGTSRLPDSPVACGGLHGLSMRSVPGLGRCTPASGLDGLTGSTSSWRTTMQYTTGPSPSPSSSLEDGNLRSP